LIEKQYLRNVVLVECKVEHFCFVVSTETRVYDDNSSSNNNNIIQGNAISDHLIYEQLSITSRFKKICTVIIIDIKRVTRTYGLILFLIKISIYVSGVYQY